MVSPIVAAFVAGIITCGFLVIAAFFVRFWARTKDGLFLVFCAAFMLMAVNQAAAVLLRIPEEDRSPLYLLRAAAFVMIILGILAKNAAGPGARRE